MWLNHFLPWAVWSAALAISWGMRPEQPSRGLWGSRVRWTTAAAMGLCCVAAMSGFGMTGPIITITMTLAGAAMGLKAYASGKSGLLQRISRENEEIAWIIRRRGSVQDQMMRAYEREAMDRRLRRCQATLMLTRRGGDDLARLFRKIEHKVEALENDTMEAAELVGAFAAHLRHVFMESDRDDIPVYMACSHVERWAAIIRQLGAVGLEVIGAPEPDASFGERRIPAMLMLGATERLGIAALETSSPQPVRWRWSFSPHSARLEADGGQPLHLPSEEFKDWDAAFMLRHGGIAHAGGCWAFELPLLPA